MLNSEGSKPETESLENQEKKILNTKIMELGVDISQCKQSVQTTEQQIKLMNERLSTVESKIATNNSDTNPKSKAPAKDSKEEEKDTKKPETSDNLPLPITTTYNEFPQRNYFVFDDLNIDTRFECGNLKKVVRTAPFTYDLFISEDGFQTAFVGKQKVWYYFKVSNVNFGNKKSEVCTFTIKNSSNNQKRQLTQGFMAPVYKTSKNPTWQYIPNKIENVKPAEKVGWQWTFRHEIFEDDGSAYFAYCFPYTHTDTLNFIDEIERIMRNNPKMYFNREIVNYSLEGRKIELLTIAARGSEPLVEKRKINTRIISRYQVATRY